MPLITWGPQLEFGISIIDSQHKRLVDMINKLDDAMKSGRGGQEVTNTLEGLVEYTHTHFRTEEGLLKDNGYEEFDLHCREHRIFTDQIEMVRLLVEGGADVNAKSVGGWAALHMACDMGVPPE